MPDDLARDRFPEQSTIPRLPHSRNRLRRFGRSSEGVRGARVKHPCRGRPRRRSHPAGQRGERFAWCVRAEEVQAGMRRAGCVLSLLLVTLIVGCGSSSTLVKGSLKADAAANPDLRGRPSPVVVRVYELKSVAAFNSADFFSLFEKEGETLSGDLIGREEYLLSPAETRPYQRQLQAGTKFIGVVAAFRDLEGSRWREAVPVPTKRGASIAIGIEARAVALAVK